MQAICLAKPPAPAGQRESGHGWSAAEPVVRMGPHDWPPRRVRRVKGGSSLWAHQVFPEMQAFAWQEGYGAFSVSESQAERVQQYIRNQAEHHKVRTFEEEFVALLERHRIEYEEKYLWD
jgi:hypothetical protein